MFIVNNFQSQNVSWPAHVFGHKLSLKMLFNFLNIITITFNRYNVININNKNHSTRRSPVDEDRMIRLALLKPHFRDDMTELIKLGF